MTDLYAVVGHPVTHSKSPWIHSRFAEQTAEDLEYTAIQPALEGFETAVAEFFERGGRGLNITVPFKEQAFALADVLTDRAKTAGAVNTFYMDGEGRLTGDNTDGFGLVTDLCQNNGVMIRGRRLLLLGAGGAVRGVLGPLLAQHPAELVIANRTLSKAESLVELADSRDSGVPVRACEFTAVDGSFDLIINGTSASLGGSLPPLPESVIGPATLTYDMMYGSETTVFNDWALNHGAASALDGLGMLVEQAAEAFYLWRGKRPDTARVLEALRGL